tara:strand:- start:3795 stop:4565 length:771 start_codon:yes stop_codon:yes gene_type:complete
MEVKKNNKANLDKYSLIMFQIGLIVSLSISYLLLESKSYLRQADTSPQEIGLVYEIDENIPITQVENVPPPLPPSTEIPVQQVVPQDVYEVVENDVLLEEGIIESTETNQADKIISREQFVPISEVTYMEEEEEIENVPFAIIEDAPIYPGCEKTKDKASRKKCMSEEIDRFVNREFDNSLGATLGLSGVQRIYVYFKISEHGNIVDVYARAPNEVLKNEAERVVQLLPKMTPGKQRGRPVRVNYAVPIIFEVRSL